MVYLGRAIQDQRQHQEAQTPKNAFAEAQQTGSKALLQAV